MLFAARTLAAAALVIAVLPSAQNQTITTFDPPGSTFTNPTSINLAGTITGLYTDASSVFQGFVLSK